MLRRVLSNKVGVLLGGVRRCMLLLVCVGAVGVFLPAQASLNLELTRGVSAAIPIAVVPFAGQTKSADGDDNLAQVIYDDLHNSGRFRTLANELLQQFPHRAQDIDFTYWQHERVDYVVLGNVEPLFGGNYRVQFSLVNVFDSPKATTGGKTATKVPDQEQILLSQQFTVNRLMLRRLAHHISDLIYEKLTGDRGVFSTKIAYIQVANPATSAAVYRLLVADADGFDPRMILESRFPIMSAAWAPDGRRLAYVSFEAQRSRIYVSDIQTGSRKLITSFPGINGAPAWSPDGRRLAVVLSKDGNRGHPKIYSVNLDGSDLRQLTHGLSIDTEPSWSADGKSLLFTSDRGGTPQIYLLTLATGAVQRLTYDGNYNARASFSQDGHYMVMLHRESGTFNIALMDMKSGDLRLLTEGSVSNESPSFAPNGRMVLFATAERKNGGSLGVTSVDGRVSLRLPGTQGDLQGPVWSPYLPEIANN